MSSMSYKVKVKKIGIVNEAGDRVVLITCYLVDPFGIALKAVDGSITFDVRVPKSAPIPDPVLINYLPNLAVAQIAKKYNRYLTATSTPIHGSNKILFKSTDVDKLFTGLTVSGPGIATTANLNSISAPTEIQLSSNLTLQIPTSTTAPFLTKTGDTTIDSNVLTNLSNTTGLIGGMFITGTGIPYGSTILAINSSTSITITQKATSGGTGNTFTFTTVTDSIYLTTTAPYFYSTIYENLTVVGPNTIPKNTTIEEVISTTKVKLTNNATDTASGTTTISGSFNYYFDTVSLTLDTSELSNISETPLIYFENL